MADDEALARAKEFLMTRPAAELIARIEQCSYTSEVGILVNQLEWQELKRRLLPKIGKDH